MNVWSDKWNMWNKFLSRYLAIKCLLSTDFKAIATWQHPNGLECNSKLSRRLRQGQSSRGFNRTVVIDLCCRASNLIARLSILLRVFLFCLTFCCAPDRWMMSLTAVSRSLLLRSLLRLRPCKAAAVRAESRPRRIKDPIWESILSKAAQGCEGFTSCLIMAVWFGVLGLGRWNKSGNEVHPILSYFWQAWWEEYSGWSIRVGHDLGIFVLRSFLHCFKHYRSMS